MTSKALEEFIENYLLERGYPLTEANRSRARRIIANHAHFISLSVEKRVAVLDRAMTLGFR